MRRPNGWAPAIPSFSWSSSAISSPRRRLPPWSGGGAGPSLKERVGPHRWAAVVVGFLGVLAIARPGAEVIRIEALLILAAALSYALFLLATRHLARTETTSALIFHSNAISLAVAAALLPFGWDTPAGGAVLG